MSLPCRAYLIQTIQGGPCLEAFLPRQTYPIHQRPAKSLALCAFPSPSTFPPLQSKHCPHPSPGNQPWAALGELLEILADFNQ